MRDDNLPQRIKELERAMSARKSTQFAGASSQIIHMTQTDDAYDLGILENGQHLYYIQFEFEYDVDNVIYTQAGYEAWDDNDDLIDVKDEDYAYQNHIMHAINLDTPTKTIGFRAFILLQGGSNQNPLEFKFKFFVLGSSEGIIKNVTYTSLGAI